MLTSVSDYQDMTCPAIFRSIIAQKWKKSTICTRTARTILNAQADAFKIVRADLSYSVSPCAGEKIAFAISSKSASLAPVSTSRL